jgi:DNA helicase-2/ATP-dependent DNA helicase PcrA
LDRLDDGELTGLIAAFEAGEYADRAPHHIEYPFTVTLGGLPVVGRIDAVYTAPAQVGDADDVQRWEVVDWKTAGHQGADPLQLALYRLAWAKIAGVPADHVAAAFYYVPTGRRVVPEQLPDEVELAQLLANSISATSRREAGRRTSPR